MGHYASEMMCNKCGQCRCTCPPKDVSQKWLVEAGVVMQVKDFDQKYKYIKIKYGYAPGMPEMRRALKYLYDTKEEAEAEASL